MEFVLASHNHTGASRTMNIKTDIEGILVYITAPDKESAHRISCALVSHKLAACATIVSDIHSVFWWEDRMEESSEVLLMVKTLRDCFSEIIELVHTIHPYDVPEIIALSITQIDEPYFQWMRSVIKTKRKNR